MPMCSVSRRSLLKVIIGSVGVAGVPLRAYSSERAELSLDDVAAADGDKSDAERIDRAIRAAIEKGVSRIVVPPKTGGYQLATTIMLPPAASKMEIIGSGVAGLISHTGSGAAFLVQAHGVSISNIVLRGTGRAADQTGVAFEKQKNVDDVDAVVSGCQFVNFARAVSCAGRGLRFVDNNVVSCLRGVELRWPTGVSETDGVLQRAPYGYRKFIFSRNFGHNVAIMFSNESDLPLAGAQITDNHIDIGRGFWSGAISWSIVEGNIARNCNRIPIYVTGDCAGLRISGVYGGLPEPATGDLSVHQPKNGVVFKGAVKALKLDVSLSDVRESEVVFEGDVEGADVTVAYGGGVKLKPAPVVWCRGNARNLAVRLAGSDIRGLGGGVEVDGDVYGTDLSNVCAGSRVAVKGKADPRSRVVCDR